ncbi:MAG TPA: hypothetical protein VEG61_05675 [Candidatus Dormibacteraeota bacterium]|nr:hypothetical protein [Candidatus Dormibacteraeota bacterium]
MKNGKTVRLDQGLPSYYGGPRPEMSIPPVLEFYRRRWRQWQSLEAIQGSQCRRLVKTISQAYDEVRYYRRLFDSVGIVPKNVTGIDDLRNLPITVRQSFQTTPLQEMVESSAKLEKCIRRCTSGSTSQPLMIYRNRMEDNLNDVSWAFAFVENGLRPFDRSAVFHSNPNMYMHGLWFERFGFWRRTPVSAWADPGEQICLLTRIRPNVIRGNPNDLLKLVSTVEREGIRGIAPRLVFTNGAFLDKQFRSLVESVFGAEVFDFYGTAELGCIGWECSRHDGYHINTDSVVLEILDAQGLAVRPGERGKIVCTGLTANTMPFIRYYTGDIGVLGDRPCQCGRGLPLLTQLEGRANEFLILSDGTEVSPNLIIQLIKRIQGIQQFKIVQEDVRQVKVDVVPDKKWGVESLALLRNVLETITRHCAIIEIALVGDIPQSPSKKFQSITSEVKRG